MSRESCPIFKVLWGRVQFIHSLLIIHSQSVILVSLICSCKIVEQTKCPTTEDVSPHIYLSILASLLELGEPLSLFCSVTCDILELRSHSLLVSASPCPPRLRQESRGHVSTGVTNRLLRNAAPHRRQIPGSRCHSHQISRATW